MASNLPKTGPLRVLHVEDNERDAALIREILESDGLPCRYTRVETEEALRHALKEEGADVVLADLSLPAFDGRTALEIVNRAAPDVPFLFVSGTIGEEAAIESIKLGATDYVLKSRLSRLPLAVQRALDEARNRAEKRQLEQQLLCIQRLEGFGPIAAGLTHDLKNLLHPIKFTSHLVEERYQDPKLQELMHLIRDSADRGLDMINQMMDLFRVSEQSLEPLDVPRLLGDLANLVHGAFPGIDVRLTLAENLPLTCGHPNEIHQALLNLAMNARDAMQNQGALHLEAAPAHLDAGFFLPEENGGTPGDYLRLTVWDTGPGIPEHLLGRIFEPLFTTKEKGGTGLGLVSVSTIVRNHRGYLRVANAAAPETGARFDLYLPPNISPRAVGTEAPAPAVAGKHEIHSHIPTGKGQVIGLATEEAALRAAARDVLETCGYRVRTAEHSGSALTQFAGEEGHVDLLILDRELSVVNGVETARAIHQHHSAMPILLVTSHPEVTLTAQKKEAGVRAILHRPFNASQLLQAVSQALDTGEVISIRA
ncbi:MAG: response regulator [Verrucomicrobium sp.]|nr:response regulator [Verrucomicrobium sp.]